jgi:pilus assembly protein CpaE
MAQLPDLSKVLFIGDKGPIHAQIIDAINSQHEFELVGSIHSSDRLTREVRGLNPGLILIEYLLAGEPTLDLIDDLVSQFPNVSVVAILPGDNPLQAQQTVMSGARSFIFHPFTQMNLLNTLRRTCDLEERHRSSMPESPAASVGTARPVRTVTVFSPRGGAGSTTIALNLALSIYEQTGERVLLMEGKLSFGHLDLMLNIRPHNTLADLIPHAARLDEALIHDVAIRHASGIYVLLAPTSLQVAQGIRPDDLYNVFLGLQKHYDYLVVDGGSSLNENTVTLMDSSDRIMLIANPELAALHDVSRFIQLSRSLSYSPEKILMVLNRGGMEGGVKPKEIETAMHQPLFAVIPDDAPKAVRSLNQGVPLLFKYPRSPIAKALSGLGKSLLGLSTTSAPVGAPARMADSSHREALLASSRLG